MKIIIEGAPKTGKTRLMTLIVRQLVDAGVVVDLSRQSPENFNSESTPDLLDGLRSSCITIEERQEPSKKVEKGVPEGGFEPKAFGTRDHYYPRYELIQPIFLKRIAKVLTKGADKYDKPEDLPIHNWQMFSPERVFDIQRHIFEHWTSLVNGYDDEDHLAHIACNVMMLMFYQETGHPITEDLMHAREKAKQEG